MEAAHPHPDLMRAALLRAFRHDQRMIPIMDLPPELRALRIKEVEHDLSDSWDPLSSGGDARLTFASFARRPDQQRAWLDLLLALAWVREYRAEHGAWPSSLPPLYPERAVLLPTPLRLRPGEADALTLLPEETTLSDLTLDMTPEELARLSLEVTASP